MTSAHFQEFGVSSALAKASEIVRWRFVDFMPVADMYICARCLGVKTHYFIRFHQEFCFQTFRRVYRVVLENNDYLHTSVVSTRRDGPPKQSIWWRDTNERP